MTQISTNTTNIALKANDSEVAKLAENNSFTGENNFQDKITTFEGRQISDNANPSTAFFTYDATDVNAGYHTAVDESTKQSDSQSWSGTGIPIVTGAFDASPRFSPIDVRLMGGVWVEYQDRTVPSSNAGGAISLRAKKEGSNDVVKFACFDEQFSCLKNADGTYRYDYGKRTNEPTSPTPTESSIYFNNTQKIGYQYNGTEWLQITAGSAFGQLRSVRNATAQTGITTSFQKVTQYTANGIEEGGVVVDLVNDEIDVPSGTWELSWSHDMTTTANNVVMTFGVFDVTDTGFTNPFIERNRKVGTGSDVGAVGGSGFIELASTTTLAMYVKGDANTDMVLPNANFSLIRIK
jgi:hypothetical protein